MAKVGAIFDLDGTIIDCSSERQFVKHLLTHRRIPAFNWLRWAAFLIAQRSLVAAKANKVYLRGQSVEEVEGWASSFFQDQLIPHISPIARERIADHKRQGHKVFLLSGSLELFVRQFSEHLGADGYVGFRLEVKDGRYTGGTEGIQPYDEGKAQLIRRLAAEQDLDLSRSYAYGNHATDVRVLELVGHPVAVQPDRRLARTARTRGWPIERWHSDAGKTRV